MSESDYDADIKPLLENFLEFDMIELADPIKPVEDEIVFIDNSKYRLQERFPLESADSNYQLFVEVYNAIENDSDTDTISNVSEPCLSSNADMESKLEHPTEESLRSLLESQFISSDEGSDHNEYEIRMSKQKTAEEKKELTRLMRKEKYMHQKSAETNEQRLVRLEKRRAYMKSYNLKKKLLQMNKTHIPE